MYEDKTSLDESLDSLSQTKINIVIKQHNKNKTVFVYDYGHVCESLRFKKKHRTFQYNFAMITNGFDRS